VLLDVVNADKSVIIIVIMAMQSKQVSQLFLSCLLVLLKSNLPHGFIAKTHFGSIAPYSKCQIKPELAKHQLGYCSPSLVTHIKGYLQHYESRTGTGLLASRQAFVLNEKNADNIEDMQNHPNYEHLFKELSDFSQRGQALSELWDSDLSFSMADYKALMRAAGQLGRTKMLSTIFQEMRLLSDNKELDQDIYDMCLKISVSRGFWRQTIFVLKDMLGNGLVPDLESFNAALCTTKGKFNVVMEIYWLMKKNNVTPDIKTYTLLLQLSNRNQKVKYGLKFIAEAESLNLEPDADFIRQVCDACLIAQEYSKLSSKLIELHKTGFKFDFDSLSKSAIKVLIETGDSAILDMTKQVAEQTEMTEEDFEEALGTAFALVFRNTCQYDDAINAMELLQSYGVSLGMRGFSSVVAEAIRAGKSEYAATLVSEMEAQGLEVRTEVYVRLIKDCAMRREHENVLKYYKTLRSNRSAMDYQYETSSRVVESVIKAKVALGDYQGAIDMFEETKRSDILELTFDMYSETVLCYYRTQNWSTVVAHVIHMQKLFSIESRHQFFLWVSCYTMAIRSSGMLQDEVRALQFLEEMRTIHDITPGLSSWSATIGACSKAGNLEMAFEVFEEMVTRIEEPLSCVPFNALMTACQENGQVDRTFEVLGLIQKHEIQPDPITYSLLVSACAKNKNWKQLKYLVQTCPESKINALLLVNRHASFDDVKDLYEWLLRQESQVDLDLFLGYINACRSSGNWEEALGTLKTMRNLKFPPNEEVYLEVLRILQRNYRTDEAFNLFLEMESLSLTITKDTYRVLMKLFLEKKRHQDLYHVVQRFMDDGMSFDYLAYLSAITACSRLKKTNEVAYHYNAIRQSPFSVNPKIYAMVTHCFLTAKMNSKAFSVLLEMRMDGGVPNEQIFIAVFLAFKKAGSYEHALDVFEEMVDAGHNPNVSLYANVLEVCSKANLPEDSCYYIQEMLCQQKQISPSMYSHALMPMIESKMWSEILDTAMELKKANGKAIVEQPIISKLHHLRSQKGSEDSVLSQKDIKIINRILKVLETSSFTN